MSRLYEMHFTIHGFEKSKGRAIIKAINKEWPLDNNMTSRCDQDKPHLECSGENNLCGGESENGFTERMAKTIFKANGKPCQVSIQATDLQEVPYTTYNFPKTRHCQSLSRSSQRRRHLLFRSQKGGKKALTLDKNLMRQHNNIKNSRLCLT